MKKNVAVKLSFLIVIVLLAIATSCTKSDNNPQYDPPADHTISKDGYMHKPGLEQPLANCVACHGNDLRGGTVGVSCYQCHGQEW
jgi:cytochrome c553